MLITKLAIVLVTDLIRVFLPTFEILALVHVFSLFFLF